MNAKDLFNKFNRVRKVLNLRLFGDENGKMWQKSVKDLSFEILSGSFSLIESMWRTIKP